MEKENQRVVVTKRLLKEGLLRLLENKNIDKINVTELCWESTVRLFIRTMKHPMTF